MSCCGTKPMWGCELEEDGNVTCPVVRPDLLLLARISTSVVFPAPAERK